MHAAVSLIFIILCVTCVKSYPNYWSTPGQPIHGVYVTWPSNAATGDLHVAASEDSGVKTHCVEKSKNIVQVAAPSFAAGLPLPYPGFPTSLDDSTTQKRAIISSQAPSPPVQYAYAVPVPSTEGSKVASYPYVYQYPSTSSETSTTKCDPQATTSNYPFQFPFNFFYPQMMSAYTNAMTILKDAGLSEDTASTVMSQTSPMWAPSSYAYPMYVMAMPSSCVQNQAATTPSTSTPTPSTQEEENTKA